MEVIHNRFQNIYCTDTVISYSSSFVKKVYCKRNRIELRSAEMHKVKSIKIVMKNKKNK